MHLSQTGPWGGSTVCDTGCRATLHITPVIYFGTLAGPCHSGSCFLHKHRRVAVIIKTNWLLNVLYITGLSKSWVVCSCHSSGHCGQSFPAHQDCLFLKPSTFLFRIKTCFVILFLSSPVPFQGYAKEKWTVRGSEAGWYLWKTQMLNSEAGITPLTLQCECAHWAEVLHCHCPQCPWNTLLPARAQWEFNSLCSTLL